MSGSSRIALSVAFWTASAACALAGDVTEVQISKLTYIPAEITVHAGDTVAWINADFVDHTATLKSDASATVWEVLILAGKTAQLLMTQPGTVEYFCRFHPNMKGKIIVLEK